MPAVNYDLMLQQMLKIGGKENQIVYWSGYVDWKNQTLTPNPTTIYLMPFFNTKDAGPMVLEIPPAEGGSITGTIMDAWQTALEDVGPAGVDNILNNRDLTLLASAFYLGRWRMHMGEFFGFYILLFTLDFNFLCLASPSAHKISVQSAF
ncbi:DUF1254 domain-containing protein [Ochrobactrum sp. CM-21-5]|nr:DUF1254 domain-containing protein [Ochrobactrum sp. CM-21-5]